jgi:protoporphyrinogen oxidase
MTERGGRGDPPSRHYGIIGAGVLGLTAAVLLGRRGHRVSVLEQSAVPGGLASSFEVAPGIWLERFYHHLFRTDRVATRWIEELGLGGRLQWHRPVTTVAVDGVPHRLDSAASLLSFGPLPVADRMRTGLTIGMLKVLPSPRPLERATADAWMRSIGGRAAHEVVWRPLLAAKFGDAYADVSMAWLWARLHDRTPQLGYLVGGFHQLYQALADGVAELGGEIRYGATVERVVARDGAVHVTWDGPDGPATDAFDRVVSTLSPLQTSRFAPGSFGERRNGAQRRPPLSAHCVVLSLDRPLTGTYWIGLADAGEPFLAVVEHTAMVPPDQYGGRHLVYLGAYRDASDPLPTLPVAEQLDRAGDLLRRLNPTFREAWIDRAWSFAAPFAQPVVDIDYRSRIPGFRTRVPGLYTANMFQVYPHDRGQNYSIALAERLVAFLERPADGREAG